MSTISRKSIWLRPFLIPLSWLYQTGVWFWKYLYRIKALKTVNFSVPVISLGNISAGGTGKTPHTAMMIELLDPYINVAVLSRGYGRQTSGYREVSPNDSSREAGDEPLLLKRRYPHIPVVVCENRINGVLGLLRNYPDLQTILLDDAYQRLDLGRHINLLLTTWQHPFSQDRLLPAGDLREPASASTRADLILVSNSPSIISDEQKQGFIKSLLLSKNIPVYFTYYEYQTPYYIFRPDLPYTIPADTDILLVTGIAHPEVLSAHLLKSYRSVQIMRFPDHHEYTKEEIGSIRLAFEKLNATQKAIITTEKDAQRMYNHHSFLLESQLPIFALPIKVRFSNAEEDSFKNWLQDRLLTF